MLHTLFQIVRMGQTPAQSAGHRRDLQLARPGQRGQFAPPRTRQVARGEITASLELDGPGAHRAGPVDGLTDGQGQSLDPDSGTHAIETGNQPGRNTTHQPTPLLATWGKSC